MEINPMKVAIEEAKTGISLKHGGPFGAVVVKDNVIIGRGHNRVIVANDPTAHAEIEAIRDACKTTGSFVLAGSTLYTTSYPCPMCLGAILWSRIGKVYFCLPTEAAKKSGFDDVLFYDLIKDNRALDEILVSQSDEREECEMLFTQYVECQNNIVY